MHDAESRNFLSFQAKIYRKSSLKRQSPIGKFRCLLMSGKSKVPTNSSLLDASALDHFQIVLTLQILSGYITDFFDGPVNFFLKFERQTAVFQQVV